MKKLFVLLSILCFTMITAQATEQAKPAPQQDAKVQAKMHRENAFEKRLELTEVQKLKARQIRQSGHEKLYPIMVDIKMKKQEAEMIRRSRMAVQMQEEQLAVIDKDLKVLEKKAQEIRKANMKEFESILTWQQKRILKQMKKEGRKNYRMQNCPHKPKMGTHPVQPSPEKNSK